MILVNINHRLFMPIFKWEKLRRVEDLNLCGLSPTRFRGVRHEPLGQPSGVLGAPTENRTRINGSANRYSIH